MAAAGWVLPQRIIDLSVAKDWPHAVQEWVPDGVDILEGDTETCLCGHNPIVELCHIRNTRNGNTAIVGNRCIEKFEAGSEGHAVFGAVPRIIDAVKRILENGAASANEALISLAIQKRVFTDRDASFYRDIGRKRNLSENQESYKLALNRKLKFGIIYRTSELYDKLVASPQSLAGHKLVEYAVSKGVLRPKDREFYLPLWNRSPHYPLSQAQTNYKVSLNRKMIEQLRVYFRPAQPPAAKRARTGATSDGP